MSLGKYLVCAFVSQDFLRPEALKVGGVFFDALFNLNKFIGFEQRDPFAERQRRNDPFETDWDRWVHHGCVFAMYHYVALKHMYVKRSWRTDAIVHVNTYSLELCTCTLNEGLCKQVCKVDMGS